MTPAPRPADDLLRLDTLRQLLILDTPPEERFDRIVRYAAREFKMPIVAVSLVDAERLWFKSQVGLDACDMGRDESFCAHLVALRDMLVVEDTTLDPRFADNPLVAGAPFVRFYAGAPLVLPAGHVAGTLCLIDHKPRRLRTAELESLAALRYLVLGELVARG